MAVVRGAAACVASAAVAVATLSATPDPAATADVAPSTPDAIYLRAIRAMKAEPQPAYVVFREDVTARNARITCGPAGFTVAVKHGDARAAYRVWFRVRDGAAVAQDLATSQRCAGALLAPAGDEIASLGTGRASPAPAAPGPGAAPTAAGPGAAAAANGPALVGAVRVEAARFYRITLVGRETSDGHDVYRLALRAYRDPNAHPLTELVVDATTFLVRRASGEVSGHYVVASGRGAGSVAFDRAGPYWVVRDERFELAFNALFVHARVDLAVRGSDYAYADALPDIAFPTPSPAPAPAAR